MKNGAEYSGTGDLTLVELVRLGQQDAFGELWKRHSGAVIAATRSFTGFDPDDVAQETFFRILQQLRSGRGPETAFRAYAIMTARHVAANMARRRSSDEVTGTAEETLEMLGPRQEDIADQVLGNGFTQSVFSSLPTRWQEVLWYREVEDLPVQVCAAYLGMSENATSVLLKRAREGFKQAWIAANLSAEKDLDADCRWTVERLPKYARGRSTPGAKRRIEAHLETCAGCRMLARESDQLHARLALVLLPAVLGVPAAAAYRAWTQSAAENASAALPVAPLPPGKASLIAKVGLIPIAVVSAGSIAVALGIGVLPALPARPAVEHADAPPQPVATAPDTASASPGAHAETPSTLRTSPSPAPNRAARSRVSATSAPAPVPDPAPERESPAPGQNRTSPGPTPIATEPPPRSPARVRTVPATIAASPEDGTEVGVFPLLIGTGRPGAEISIRVVNLSGERRSARVTVDSTGRWRYTPSSILGVLTVDASQSYSAGGVSYVEQRTRIGVYQVGDGLRMQVSAAGANQSVLRITGFGPPSKNQVANVTSSAHGSILSKQAMTSPGELVVTVPYSRSSLGRLRFWQGDTSLGPYRVWTSEAHAHDAPPEG